LPQGYLALVYSVLAAFVCKHPQHPTPHPQERCSYDKAKYGECTGEEDTRSKGRRSTNYLAGAGAEEFWLLIVISFRLILIEIGDTKG
jgi:hypothetical protein